MDRKEFLEVLAAVGAVFLVAAIGGMTAKEDGMWGDEEEPPP